VTFRITQAFDGQKTTLKISGRIRSRDVQEIENQIKVDHDAFTFDLQEVTIVDMEAVRFLGFCELRGVELVNCAQYIRDWISRERNQSQKD
jgi:hypothetical protein